MKADPCPLPELVQASRMETLPPGVQERVAAHVFGCESCQALLEALDDPEIGDPTPEERLRLRARVRASVADEPVKAVQHGVLRWTIAAAAAVVIGAMVTMAVWQLAKRESPASPRQTARLEKPALPARNGKGLVWRGTDAGAAQDLSRSLEPYAANNFPEAARRLSAFVDRHPESAAGFFYLGVSRLFLESHTDAVAALEQAERLARDDANLAGEIAWYLALAYQRANQPDRGRSKLADLCRSRHARAAQACAAPR